MKRYALIFALGISSQALAADVTIEMLNKDADGNKMVYSEEIVRIGIGDTVTWVLRIKAIMLKWCHHQTT